MAKKITELTAETIPAAGDLVAIVDVSDTSQSANGTTQKITFANFFTNVGAIESDVSTIAATGATETLDVSAYGVFDCTMDQSCAFTFSNPAPSGDMTAFVLIIRGAYTPSFTNTIIWADGAAPTYATPSTYVFWTVNGGTTYFGVGRVGFA